MVRALVAAGLIAALTFSSPHPHTSTTLSVVPSSIPVLSRSASSYRNTEWRTLAEAVKKQQDLAAWYAASKPKPVIKVKTKAPVAKIASPPQTYDSGSVEAIIMSIFGSVGQSAINVARCESTLNPSAVSKGGANWGLFQINSVHKDDFEAYTGQPWSEVLNAKYNTEYAKKLYDSLGWSPWACKWAA